MDDLFVSYSVLCELNLSFTHTLSLSLSLSLYRSHSRSCLLALLFSQLHFSLILALSSFSIATCLAFSLVSLHFLSGNHTTCSESSSPSLALPLSRFFFPPLSLSLSLSCNLTFSESLLTPFLSYLPFRFSSRALLPPPILVIPSYSLSFSSLPH